MKTTRKNKTVAINKTRSIQLYKHINDIHKLNLVGGTKAPTEDEELVIDDDPIEEPTDEEPSDDEESDEEEESEEEESEEEESEEEESDEDEDEVEIEDDKVEPDEDAVKGKRNPVLHNLFKTNINNFNFDKSILEENKNDLHSKKDAQYFLNAVEILNSKLIDDTANKDIDADDKKYKMDYLYPHLDDKYLNLKISQKKEFNEYKQNVNINKDIGEEGEKLCNQNFELAPHQNFVKNFLSENTPYNGMLLYHGLGTGKTCSAIGIAEETRRYMKYNGSNKEILIVASPNVQINFRLQLFDETKLKYVNERWTINNCAGQNILDEINALQSKISREKVVRLVENIINSYYIFVGYIELANLINKHSNINNIVKDNPKITKKKQNQLIKNKLDKFFSNRLVIIDEIHNVRDSKETSNKLVAKQIDNLVRNVSNMKLVLLSATPMFNDYKEIIFLINLLNSNDNRSVIDVKDVFNNDGEFIVDEDGNEVGKELLQRKLNGYVSYIKGDNPFIFPYRILPQVFDNNNSIKHPDFNYPVNNVLGNRFEEPTKISYFDIYVSKLSEYQEKVYNYIVNKTDFKEGSDSYKYTLLLKPLEALNMVYPMKELETAPIESVKSLKLDVKKLVGKSALSNIMSYEEDAKQGYRFNYKFNDPTMENVFLRENLVKYSSKISNIIDSIENSTGPIIIYSQFIDGGLIPVALALEAYGFKRYGGGARSLFGTPPVEELDVMSYKPKSQALKENNKFRGAKYIMITGDKILSPNKEVELKSCNDSNNVYGENIKVILISSAGSEGLDFKYIRQIHILEPWYNINRIEQIIGRGVRTCSHKDLPLAERNVQIFMYASLLSNLTIETIDLLIYRKAEEKAKLIGNVTRILKEISVDCHLNYDLNLFSENKMSELVNNELDLTLSNNKTVKYKVGDKPFTALCDYMESCEYYCNPSKEDYTMKEGEEDNLKTYNDSYLQTTNSKIIKIIQELFKENYFYRKEELIGVINMRDDFSLLAINNALDELINNELQSITDKYNRQGRLINIDNLYIYQPLELDNEKTSIYNRSTPVNSMIDSITYDVDEPVINDDVDIKINGPTKTDETVKANIVSGEKVVEGLVHHQTNIMSGNKQYVTKLENSKYNYLAYVINFNNDVRWKNILKFDLELLPKIILHILIDNLDRESYLNLISYIYNTSGDDKPLFLEIKEYLEQSIVEAKHNKSTLRCVVIPSKGDINDIYTIYMLKENTEGKISLIKGQQTDYTRLGPNIISKYTLPEPKYRPDAYAFIDVPKKESEFYQFKIIYLKEDKFTKGKICTFFKTILDRYESFMIHFLTKKEYDKLTGEYKLGKYICTIAEMYFRQFDLNKEKGFTNWFLSTNQAVINKITPPS
ncbi:hypothetical protein PGAG_00199 [Phaeocystis globosa virus 12T]|uniref:Helicase C-terminal domain protein n=1 Tax=Phaeocystis globosa virus PgV-16T TaxID=3071227 RepID=A0AC59EX69_9VIRU|nr:helicase C-terminal domain protein [Phaeocystis globosa virus]AET73088.1 hypothetical protein PGAG_00199 [Phaeocystis globosa virus 12T]AET73910.1 hypothetical protein PGBG_00202 [Phaeocystis globosa virus 14T]AGM15550.1 helicase C-terminal domain protein [Phaeocystis globosa virus PgV-16T]UYE94280.1 helicase C-terminal domain protein [Phaeocystis globosa virus]